MTTQSKHMPLTPGKDVRFNPVNWFAKAVKSNDSSILSDGKSEYGNEDVDYIGQMSVLNVEDQDPEDRQNLQAIQNTIYKKSKRKKATAAAAAALS